MTTVHDQFQKLPDNGLRQKAVDNTSQDVLRMPAPDLYTALHAFKHRHTPQGEQFWGGVLELAKGGYYE